MIHSMGRGVLGLVDAFDHVCGAVVRMERVDAGALVRELCAELRGHALRRSIRLAVYASCEGVCVHLRSFADTLRELIRTAIDRTPVGGAVVLTVRPSLRVVVCEISAGPGLDGVHDPLIVGLAMRIVAGHGGHMSFTAEPVSGTLASLWLPSVLDDRIDRTQGCT